MSIQEPFSLIWCFLAVNIYTPTMEGNYCDQNYGTSSMGLDSGIGELTSAMAVVSMDSNTPTLYTSPKTSDKLQYSHEYMEIENNNNSFPMTKKQSEVFSEKNSDVQPHLVSVESAIGSLSEEGSTQISPISSGLSQISDKKLPLKKRKLYQSLPIDLTTKFENVRPNSVGIVKTLSSDAPLYVPQSHRHHQKTETITPVPSQLGELHKMVSDISLSNTERTHPQYHMQRHTDTNLVNSQRDIASTYHDIRWNPAVHQNITGQHVGMSGVPPLCPLQTSDVPHILASRSIDMMDTYSLGTRDMGVQHSGSSLMGSDTPSMMYPSTRSQSDPTVMGTNKERMSFRPIQPKPSPAEQDHRWDNGRLQNVRLESSPSPPLHDPPTEEECRLAAEEDDDGDIPLHIAVVQEEVDVVDKLVAIMKHESMDFDHTNKMKQTALHLAIITKQVGITKKLLKAGASPNIADRKGFSCCHLGVKYKTPECLEILFLHSRVRVDVDAKNYDGLSALHRAIQLNQLDCAQVLLNNGAQINIVDGKSGKTPLYLAFECNQPEAADLLLTRGADVNIPTYSGSTVLQAANTRGQHLLSHLFANSNIEMNNSSVRELQNKMAAKNRHRMRQQQNSYSGNHKRPIASVTPYKSEPLMPRHNMQYDDSYKT